MLPRAAFYVMVWVFSVHHPNGDVTDRQWDFKNHFTMMECDSKSKALSKKTKPGMKITDDGGTVIYSRFACVPVLSGEEK